MKIFSQKKFIKMIMITLLIIILIFTILSYNKKSKIENYNKRKSKYIGKQRFPKIIGDTTEIEAATRDTIQELPSFSTEALKNKKASIGGKDQEIIADTIASTI